MRQLFLGMLLAFILFNPREGQAKRAIPDDNLAYPVLITCADGSQGSGFFLNSSNKLFLVTAAHVLFDLQSGKLTSNMATLLSYSREPKEAGKNILHLDLAALLSSNKIRKHTTEDVAIVYVADIGGYDISIIRPTNYFKEVTSLEKAPSGILMADLHAVKHFADILTANPIYVFGYPTSLGMKNYPQIDYQRPLLRSGIIAGTNPVRKTIILDCPIYPGNSGGPVLEVEADESGGRKFRVIGVVTEFIPFVETWKNETHKYTNINMSNSGYAVSVSMDPVLELINAQ